MIIMVYKEDLGHPSKALPSFSEKIAELRDEVNDRHLDWIDGVKKYYNYKTELEEVRKPKITRKRKNRSLK